MPTADRVEVASVWTTTPDATSEYVAVGPGNNIIAVAEDNVSWLEEWNTVVGFLDDEAKLGTSVSCRTGQNSLVPFRAHVIGRIDDLDRVVAENAAQLLLRDLESLVHRGDCVGAGLDVARLVEAVEDRKQVLHEALERVGDPLLRPLSEWPGSPTNN